MKRLALMVIVVVVVGMAAALLTRQRAGAPGTVNIGVLLPLTGPVAEPGNKALNGLRLAIDQYNETATRKIVLVVEDSRSDPKSGVSAAQKLINVDAVKVIVGDLMSSVAMAVAPIAQEHEVVLFAPGASNPRFPDMGSYMFRNWASDDYDGEVMADYIFTRELLRNGGIAYVNNEYGLGLASAFKRRFESMGGRISLFEGYEQGSTDFRPVVARLRSIPPLEFLYLPGQPLENGYLVKQVREGAVRVRLYANLSVESPEFARIVGEQSLGIVFTSPAYEPATVADKGKTFEELYKAAYGTAPDVVAGHAYDAGNILIQALRSCNFAMPRLREALSVISAFPGVTGTTTFLPNGDVKKDVFVKQLRAKEPAVLLERFGTR